MADTCITDDHFYFWIEYYNKKGEVTCETDVNEEIDVYEDHIRYENYCPGCWEDYYDFEYKLEGDKLMIKCINFKKISFGEKYESYEFNLVKNGVYNGKEMEKYFSKIRDIKERYEVGYAFDYRDSVKELTTWFERKGSRRGCQYTQKAKDWIIKQIKNKNFKKNS